MKKHQLQLLAPMPTSLIVVVSAMLVAGAQVNAQCPEVISGLVRPLGITRSSQGTLLISETGTRQPNTGRISILDVDGHRRTLLDGLPSGINDVSDPSGPAGLFLRGRTLYLLIGSGDVGIRGPAPGTDARNPKPVSSPLFSSVLAIHFSDSVEKETEGFTLTLGDHWALANGEKVTLSNGGGDRMTIERVADFPDFIPFPLPNFAENIQLSNPFDLVAVADQLYVTDGGRNLVWQVDIPTGSISVVTAFPNIPNPLFPNVGGPFSEAVPTGIRYSEGRLLVALFRGAPFAPGTSVIEQVDPLTGDHAPFISGLKTAIDVLPITNQGTTDYLVLQHASVGPFFGGPGVLLRFPGSGGAPVVVADCLEKPTSMTLDEKIGAVYVTELLTGSVVTIPLAP